MLKVDPYNLDLHAERIPTVYRWRSKPEFTSHESVVLQPWSSGPNPKPLDIYLRIHLVLDSCDMSRPLVESQVVSHREEMYCVCEIQTWLTFQEEILHDLIRSLGDYSYEASCITFAESVLEALSRSAVIQRNTMPLWDQAKVFLANVVQVIHLFDNFHDLVFFCGLLGSPFTCIGAAYFAFAALIQAFQGIGFARNAFCTVGGACRKFWIQNSHLSIQEFGSILYREGLLKAIVLTLEMELCLSCMFVFRIWVFWLWTQGSVSILAILVLENSIQIFMGIFKDITGPILWGSSDTGIVVNWCGTLLQTIICVGHKRFFKFALSLMLFLPAPWLLPGSLTVLCIAWLVSCYRVMEFYISLKFFTGWNPKILFSAYLFIVSWNQVMNPLAEVLIEPWIMNLVFYWMFFFSAIHCPLIYIQSLGMRKSLNLEAFAPLEALHFDVPFFSVKQVLMAHVLQLEQITEGIWLILLQQTLKLVRRLTPFHTLLLGIAIACPWIAWFLGFSVFVCYVMFVCSAHMFVTSICVLYRLKFQIDICKRQLENRGVSMPEN